MTRHIIPRGVTILLASAIAGVVLPAAALAATPAVGGQSAAATNRPKICLVLSGGGARGAAHVGVIKVLEEYRVPILSGATKFSLLATHRMTWLNSLGAEDRALPPPQFAELVVVGGAETGLAVAHEVEGSHGRHSGGTVPLAVSRA